MTYGDSLSTTIPAVGAAGTGYATSINARLAEVETVLESKVPYSSLTGSELDLNNVPIRDATYVELYEGASAPGASPVGRLARYQNNLYWVTDEGAVRLTVNGAIDSSSIGGIGGNYGGANPSFVTFDEGTSQYRFYENFSTTTWGYLRSLGLDIADGAATTDVVRLRAPAIAASYDFTFPATLPSGRALMTIDASGQTGHSPSTGVIQVGPTFDTNINVTLTGTGKIIHNDRRFHVALDYIGTPITGAHTRNAGFIVSGTAGTYYIEVTGGWQENYRAKALVVYFRKVDGSTLTVDLERWADDALVSTVATNTSTTTGLGSVTATLGTPETLPAGSSYYIQISTGTNNDRITGAHIVYDVIA